MISLKEEYQSVAVGCASTIHGQAIFIQITLHLFQVQDTKSDQTVHGGLDGKMHRKPYREGYPPGKCSPDLKIYIHHQQHTL